MWFKVAVPEEDEDGVVAPLAAAAAEAATVVVNAAVVKTAIETIDLIMVGTTMKRMRMWISEMPEKAEGGGMECGSLCLCRRWGRRKVVWLFKRWRGTRLLDTDPSPGRHGRNESWYPRVPCEDAC